MIVGLKTRDSRVKIAAERLLFNRSRFKKATGDSARVEQPSTQQPSTKRLANQADAGAFEDLIRVNGGFGSRGIGAGAKPCSDRRKAMTNVANGKENRFSQLRELSFFRGLDDAQLRELTDLAIPLEFPGGTLIFSECEPASDFFVIISGCVFLEICGPQKCTTIMTLGPGELLGWSTLLGSSRLTATARCQEATRVFVLAGSEVNARVDKNPRLGHELMRCVANSLSQRLTATRLQLLDLFQGQIQHDQAGAEG